MGDRVAPTLLQFCTYSRGGRIEPAVGAAGCPRGRWRVAHRSTRSSGYHADNSDAGSARVLTAKFDLAILGRHRDLGDADLVDFQPMGRSVGVDSCRGRI